MVNFLPTLNSTKQVYNWVDIGKMKRSTDYNERIKSLRLSKGWSLRQVALQLSLSHNTIAKWEKDPDVIPSRANALKLAELFDVEPGWLIFGNVEGTKRSKTIASKLDMLNEHEVNQIENMVDLLIDNKKGSTNGKKNGG